MQLNLKYMLILLSFSATVSAGTRVAYSRPGMMMRIPTSSNTTAPYLFRTGFGTEIHNLNPFNTAGGLFFDMEISRGFSFGFSAVGDRGRGLCGFMSPRLQRSAENISKTLSSV